MAASERRQGETIADASDQRKETLRTQFRNGYENKRHKQVKRHETRAIRRYCVKIMMLLVVIVEQRKGKWWMIFFVVHKKGEVVGGKKRRMKETPDGKELGLEESTEHAVERTTSVHG